MNDLPWEVKKDSKKEPSMDALSVEFPWEKGSSTEEAKELPALEPSEPIAIPPLVMYLIF